MQEEFKMKGVRGCMIHFVSSQHWRYTIPWRPHWHTNSRLPSSARRV